MPKKTVNVDAKKALRLAKKGACATAWRHLDRGSRIDLYGKGASGKTWRAAAKAYGVHCGTTKMPQTWRFRAGLAGARSKRRR